MNRELLERPFPPDEIRHRAGRYGKVLDYVEGRSVVQRLNEAFDGNWSFQIERYDIREEAGEVVVLGRLSAGDVVKTQFGGSTLTRSRDGGELVSLADDCKAAATDSLKKAASLFGVALHLYTDEPSASPGAPPPGTATEPTTPAPAPSPSLEPGEGSHVYPRPLGAPPEGDEPPAGETPAGVPLTEADVPGADGSEPDGRGAPAPPSSPPPPARLRPRGQVAPPDARQEARLTARQFSFLMSLLTETGVSKHQADEHCRQHYGASLAHLSRPQASALIDALVERSSPLLPPTWDGRRDAGRPSPAPARGTVLPLPTTRSPHGQPASPSRVP